MKRRLTTLASIAAIAALLALPSCGTGWLPLVSNTTTTGTWSPIKAPGNGGVISRLDVAADGTFVIGTDTFGGYVWNSGTDQWQQLLTTGMPSAAYPDGVNGTNSSQGLGIDEIRIAPSDSNIIAMMYDRNLYKSADKGSTFSLLGCSPWPANYPIGANQAPIKAWGPYGAIDPNNPDVIYWSTPSAGPYFSNNGGTTCAQISGIPGGLPANVANTGGSPSIGTDTTSLAIGTGSKAFTNNSGSFAFTVSTSEFVQVWETADPTNQMLGYVTASSGTTFTLNIVVAQGSGTHSDWTISHMMDTNGQIGGLRDIGGGNRIVFDTSGGTTIVSGQTRTKNIFIHAYNVNTYKSTDGGVTWAAVNATGRPNGIRRMAVDLFGVLWAVDDDYNFVGSKTNLDKLDGTTWTNNIDMGAGVIWFDQVAVDTTQCPAKATCHVAAWQGSNAISALTVNGGAAFNLAGNGGAHITYVSSGDVDWLGAFFTANSSHFFGGAAAAFDPQHSGRMYLGAEGTWYLTPPSVGADITLTQQSRGIQQFITTQILSPLGASGSVLMGTWDFPCFYTNSFTTYPSAITCAAGNTQGDNLLRGFSFDYVYNAPTTIASIVQLGTGAGTTGGVDYSGITTTGGATSGSWTQFAAKASTAVGGCIAMADATHIVWVSTNSANKPQITTNGGTSWADISIPGGTPSTGWGPINTAATYSKMCDSDKTNGNVILYNVNDGVTGDQFFLYTKATGLWSTQSHPNFGSGANINEKVKSVHGQAGHWFFTPGLGGDPHPNAVSFYYTTDDWATKHTVTGFQEVIAFGFGAIFSGQSYPAIFVDGWLNGVYGIYMCKGFNTATSACDTTWQLIGTYPNNILVWPLDIDGDKGLAGQVYLQTNGGAFYGQFN